MFSHLVVICLLIHGDSCVPGRCIFIFFILYFYGMFVSYSETFCSTLFRVDFIWDEFHLMGITLTLAMTIYPGIFGYTFLLT